MNTNGYTLVESVITLFILTMLAFLLPLSISFLSEVGEPTNFLHSLQLDLFFEQLSMEVREAKAITIDEEKLFLTKESGDVVSIEQYGQMLRRRVNGAGHDTFLYDVAIVQFERIPHGVQVTVIHVSGLQRERRLFMAYGI